LGQVVKSRHFIAKINISSYTGKMLYHIKIIIAFLGIGLLLTTCSTGMSRREQHDILKVPFSRGVTFSHWFEAPNVQGIQTNRFIEKDFADVKKLGVEVIRLPVNLNCMTSGAPDYIIDPFLLKLLDEAVDLAEKYQLYIILDNHPLRQPVTDYNIDKVLIPVWTQMAGHFKDRSEYVLYEILNEPNGISTSRWGQIQGEVIKAIRKVDQNRTIIAGGVEWNSIRALASLPVYPDPNLIYTFHFYDPVVFTNPSVASPSLRGVPWPYDRSRMPKNPNDFRESWMEREWFENYRHEAAPAAIARKINRAAVFSRRRNVPVFCGEFGAVMFLSPPEDRVRWINFISTTLSERNIPWAFFDYSEYFGLFNNYGGRDIDAELNVDLVRALGFTPPPQQNRVPEPVRTGFIIYDDYVNPDCIVTHTFYLYPDMVLSLLDTQAVEEGYAIKWGNFNRYEAFGFNFRSIMDLSYLAAAGYNLEFKARTEKPVRFDVRFINPENHSSIPWRMNFNMDETLLPPDGQWHTIRIPLADMHDQGAWSNTSGQWLNSQGAFSWERVKQLEFSAEQDFSDNIWIDSIKITGP
jgi:endoglucanase